MLDVAEARRQADAYLKEHGDRSYTWRSCWNCNDAHEHLKNVECPLLCNQCGRFYFKGVDITADSNGPADSNG